MSKLISYLAVAAMLQATTPGANFRSYAEGLQDPVRQQLRKISRSRSNRGNTAGSSSKRKAKRFARSHGRRMTSRDRK